MDWKCDICNKPESEVGTILSGRTPKGRDFQLCRRCLEVNELEKLSDVDKYYDKEENK